MKTVVIDTNELTKDWLLTGLKYQLIEHMFHQTWMEFCVPAVVVEELVANYGRAAEKVRESGEKLNRERKRLGLEYAQLESEAFDYRDYLDSRLEERLNFSVLKWPEASHERLVRRAVNRVPPFNEKGGGYRDALVWQDVLTLVRQGCDVALVSQDKTFAGDDGKLAPELQTEVEGMSGSVELVSDFNRWLLSQLPWQSVGDLSTAVAYSRQSEFYDYYVNSDFQSDLVPSAEDLGFSAEPYHFEIVDVGWEGQFTAVDGGNAIGDGLTLVEYDIGQAVEFTAELPAGVELDPNWDVSETDALGRVLVQGVVYVNLRVAVLFGGDHITIEELSWHPQYDVVSRIPIHRPDLDPNQPPLF